MLSVEVSISEEEGRIYQNKPVENSAIKWMS